VDRLPGVVGARRRGAGRAWSGPAGEVRGTLHTHRIAEAEGGPAHTVSVWLPPGYDTTGAEKYPVLYVQDGERLFRPEATDGPDWQVDEILSRLIATGRLPPLIVVGVHSSERRLREYMPAVPFYLQPDSLRRPLQRRIGRPLTNEYLQYLYEDVTMFVRQRYHADPAASRTFIAGQGVGGLCALYAVAKMPFASRCTPWPRCRLRSAARRSLRPTGRPPARGPTRPS